MKQAKPAGDPAKAWFWPLALLLIVCAVFCTLPFGLNNWLYLTADEGVAGLMARHLAQGRHFPLYVYGQGYVGAPEIYWLALFFLFLPASPLVLGLAMLVLLGFYLVLAAFLIRRGAGELAALACLALAVLAPPFFGRTFSVCLPSHTIIMVLGALFQLAWLALCLPQGQKNHPAAWLPALGILFFLGLWAKALFIFFVLPPLFINLYFLGSACRENAVAPAAPYLPKSLAQRAGAILKWLGGLYLAYAFAVLAFGRPLKIECWGIRLLSTSPETAGSQDVILGGLILALGFIWPWWFRLGAAGRRRVFKKARPHFYVPAALALGLLLKKLLDLLFKMTPEFAWGGGTHYLHMVSSPGLLRRWGLLGHSWVPRLFLPDTGTQPWIAYALFLLLVAAAAWILAQAGAAWRRGGFARWIEENWLAFFCAASTALFLLAMLSSAASQDEQSIRYMSVLYAWWPFLFFWLLKRLSRTQWLLGAGLAVFLLATLAYPLAAHRLARANWTPTRWQDQGAGRDLLRLLHAGQVKFGYADYWVAYLVDFLTEERLVLSPSAEYDLSRVRYPPYLAAVKRAKKKAYVFRASKDARALARVVKKLRAQGRPFRLARRGEWAVLFLP